MLASHADVLTGSSRNHSSCGVGTRDEPLRTFVWEANIVWQFFIPLYHPLPLLLAHQVHLNKRKQNYTLLSDFVTDSYGES